MRPNQLSQTVILTKSKTSTLGVILHRSTRLITGISKMLVNSSALLSVLSWTLIYPRTLDQAENPLDPADEGNGGYISPFNAPVR